MGRPLGRVVSLGPGWSQPLEEELTGQGGDAAGPLVPAPAAPSAVPLQYQGLGQSVRVHSYCVADGFDRGALQDAILRRSVTLRAYQDVLCMQYRRGGGTTRGYADIFFFDSGVVVFWGLDTDAERYILDELVLPSVAAPLAPARVERDRLTVTYSARGAACIEDDEIRLHWSRAEDPAVKLAVSFALAESTKLSVFEEDLRSLGKSLSYLPAMLAGRGRQSLAWLAGFLGARGPFPTRKIHTDVHKETRNKIGKQTSKRQIPPSSPQHTHTHRQGRD